MNRARAKNKQVMAVELVDDPDDLLRISTSDDQQWLMAEFQKEHQASLKGIRRMAAIVHRLHEKGFPLPKCSQLHYLLRIADGLLDHELYFVARDHKSLLDRAQLLLREEQNKIARNVAFEVATLDGSHLKIEPLAMTNLQIQQVFGNGKVRSLSEQRAWLQERLEKDAVSKVRPTEPLYRIDKKRNGIVLTAPGFLSAGDIAHALGELAKRR